MKYYLGQTPPKERADFIKSLHREHGFKVIEIKRIYRHLDGKTIKKMLK